MRRFFISLSILTIAAAFLAAAPAAAQQKDRVYTYALRQTMGAQSTQVNNLIQKIVALIFKQMNLKVQFVVAPENNLSGFIRDKKADFIYLDHSDFQDMIAKGYELHPVNTTGTRGHLKEYRCMAVQKNSPYQTAADLKGKAVATPWSLGDFIAMRSYLESAGLGSPEKFFGDFVHTADELESMLLVADGKLESAYVPMMSHDFLKFTKGSLANKVRMIDCRELSWPTAPVVWIGKPEPEMLKKFYAALAGLETNPEFKQLKPILNVVRNQLYLVTDKDYDGFKKLYNQSKKNGWAAEFERIKKK